MSPSRQLGFLFPFPPALGRVSGRGTVLGGHLARVYSRKSTSPPNAQSGVRGGKYSLPTREKAVRLGWKGPGSCGTQSSASLASQKPQPTNMLAKLGFLPHRTATLATRTSRRPTSYGFTMTAGRNRRSWCSSQTSRRTSARLQNSHETTLGSKSSTDKFGATSLDKSTAPNRKEGG